MPVKSDIAWTMDDISSAALPIGIPLGIAGLGWYFYMQNPSQQEWIDKLKKPSWVITNPTIMAAIDLTTVAVAGYGSHQICKHIRTTDRQVALGLYGTGLLIWAASIPCFTQKKDIKAWAGFAGLAAGLFGASAAAFYKLDNNAGLMVAPLAAWLAYQTFGLVGTMQANPGF